MTLSGPPRPVLSWQAWRRDAPSPLPGLADLTHKVLVTSGRAALYHALRQLDLPAGARVLVPTYHCPTLVAPVRQAGLALAFYPLQADGLPRLSALDRSAKALIVSHLFGYTRSLRGLRAWCDEHGVALIEDCAHALAGQAGERPVGSWGDYATASLTKFCPVPEAGLLASARHPLKPLSLVAPSARDQLKGWFDVLETGAAYRRLPGLNGWLGAKLRQRLQPAAAVEAAGAPGSASEQALYAASDMARTGSAPLAAARRFANARPGRSDAIARQRNFARYDEALRGIPGVRQVPGFDGTPQLPYAYPLWVDDADRVYAALRRARQPVFRWDRIWPGTPRDGDDAAVAWSRHLLQLLCHQSLTESDVDRLSCQIRDEATIPTGARP